MANNSDTESDGTPASSASASPATKAFYFGQPQSQSSFAESSVLSECVGSDQTSTSSRGLCALKLISKQEFWKQVETGLERKDTVVREVLAQSSLLNSIISCVPSSSQHLDSLALHEMELPIVQINGVFESRFVMSSRHSNFHEMIFIAHQIHLCY